MLLNKSVTSYKTSLNTVSSSVAKSLLASYWFQLMLKFCPVMTERKMMSRHPYPSQHLVY
jgi:hypothetical protein